MQFTTNSNFYNPAKSYIDNLKCPDYLYVGKSPKPLELMKNLDILIKWISIENIALKMGQNLFFKRGGLKNGK